jgi:hypothetical protein
VDVDYKEHALVQYVRAQGNAHLSTFFM